MYFINKFKNATYVTHVFHFNPLSFNSIVPTKKKKKQLGANFGSKELNYAKKKVSKIKLKIKKKLLLQSTVIYE
jgi:uncharacterized protein YktA (UPF0223 family)